MIDPPLLTAAATSAAAAAGALAYGTFAPRSQVWGRLACRGDPAAGGPPAVALTFDDGPTAGPTNRILDVLRDAGVRAAFFVVGRNVERWPDLVRRMDAEGHLVGNHTYDHGHYGVMRAQRYWDAQVRRTDEAIERVLGKRPAMFRPPMGFKTWHTIRAARKRGLAVVTWTLRAVDGIPTTPARILARLEAPATAGDVLLLHDGIEPNAGPRDTRPTESALPPLIAGLRAKGLEIRRLDELLGLAGYQGGRPAATGSLTA